MEEKDIMTSLGYHKLDVEVAVGSYEEAEQLSPDLMHIRFIMCHEGINANGDTFTKEVLKRGEDTPRYKPVNWEHGQPMIGHILSSEYKEDASGVGYIEASGVIWKFAYPELSSQIKAKASTGELKLSMECYYKDANYMIGDQIFDQEVAEKMGIIPYVGREYQGKKVARIFKEVLFGGVGVVAKPADKKAVFLSVAKDLGAHGINTDNLDEEAISAISKTIADAIMRSVNDFNTKTVTKKDNHAITVARYVKAFDKAKSNVVSKFNKEELTTKEQMLIDVRNSINTLLSEVASINESYYRGIASEEDSIEDKIEQSLASALNSEVTEAYLKTIEEDYITYDVVDYSLQHPDSIKSFKASFSNSENELTIDFANASEITLQEGEIQPMAENIESQAAELETPVVEQPVVEETPEVVESAEATELKAQLASLQEAFEAEKAEKQTLASKVAEFEARFAEIESEKVLASRLAELKESGIEFTGTRLEKESARIKLMSDEDFADHKELLVEVAGNKAEATKEDEIVEEEVEEVIASDEDVEEVIVVERPNSSAGLVIEEKPEREIRPFGHLRK